MMRISRTGFVVRLFTGLTAIAGLAVMAFVSSEGTTAAAAKPAPPPPGIIDFKQQPSLIGAKLGDGSSYNDSLPAAAMNTLSPFLTFQAVPVAHVYSGSRWWITTAVTGYYDSTTSLTGTTKTNVPHYDVVAVRKRPGSTTQIDVIQLTDFYGVLNISQWSAHPSNDTNDNLLTSFVGATIQDLRDTFVEHPDGTTFYDEREAPISSLRLPLTVSEFLSPGFEPFDGALTDEEIDDLLGPNVPLAALNRFAATSPDGLLSLSTYNNRLIVVNAAAPDYDHPVYVLANGSTDVTPPSSSISYPQWSPDGSKVAYCLSNSEVWVVSATGGTPKKVLASTATSKFIRPIWSADSQYVVATRNDYSGTTITSTRLVRVPAGGGTAVDLGVIGTGAGPALRWVPSN